MFKHFKRATRHLAQEDILSSSAPPFPGFTLPPIINTLYNDIVAQQAARGHEVAGGFAFGGLFNDINNGKRPKDLDVYIAIPKLLTRIEDRVAEGWSSYSDKEECEDDINAMIGYDFPLNLHLFDTQPVKADLFGSYIVAQALYEKDKEHGMFDIIIGKEPVRLNEFLAFTSAPIMAVGATLGKELEYSHHKDYADHAANNILCSDNPSRSNLAKAEAKGWTVMTQAEVQERQAKSLSEVLDVIAKAKAPTLTV